MIAVARVTDHIPHIGGPEQMLDKHRIRAFVLDQLELIDLKHASVCVLVPDATRSFPLPLMLSAVSEALRGRARAVTVLIALGTHAAMTERALATHLGYAHSTLEETYPGMSVRNHAWWDPSTFAQVGSISAERIEQLSDGMLSQSVDIRINRALLEHDLTLILGPVFPHEVVGFSGGHKYLFPGVSGRELIDLSHWLGALITSPKIIGTLGITPVRALIEEAAAMVPGERRAFCAVTRSRSTQLHYVAFGEPLAAWQAAAEVSARAHITYLERPVQRVLALVPERYDDLWTGAKGFYKVEPIVADGGEVVVYAPHIRSVATTHPDIERIGYHCRDYFVKQWDRFEDYAWGDLAHSTHLRGLGTYDPVEGERDRVTVTLATSIPEDVTRAANLEYLDPATIDPTAWAADPNTLVVPDAGEDLYRLRSQGR